MEEVYYHIHVNGQQKGPFAINQLLQEGLTPETMVWRPGMQGWMPASSLPELRILFENRPPVNPYGYQSQEPYGKPQFNPYAQYGPQVPGGYPPGWTNWLGWAIAGTILGFLTCCLGLIFGIIAIVKANQANTQARAGNYDLANITNDSAKTWTIVSLVLGALGIIGSIVAFFCGLYDMAFLANFN